jgi:23S rRNA (uracil1939-C5)-methyltransferase
VIRIDSLDHEGRGVARVDGKVVFVDGGLPGESVDLQIWKHHPKYDLANATRILRASSLRVVPPCPHFDRCGGCSLQHLEPRAQVAMKQRVLEDNLARIGKVECETILSPIHGPAWGYRHRARLSARYVAKKGGALVGFRERRTHMVVDMNSCDVLPARISALIAPLRELVSTLDLAARIPQIEIAVGDDATVLTIRVLDAPEEGDLARLHRFAAERGVGICLQTAGPDSIRAIDNEATPWLSYRLPEFDLELRFLPSDFTQVNQAVNTVLVRRAVAMLAPANGEIIADLFCGLGNFTLALGRRGAQVYGVEGSKELVERAAQNASRNALAKRVKVFSADLLEHPLQALERLPKLDKMLIDPPRAGAFALVQALGAEAPPRIVYVSCDPATLARDAGVLVHNKGYRLQAAGVINMFPHTSHVESIAVFQR